MSLLQPTGMLAFGITSWLYRKCYPVFEILFPDAGLVS